MNQEHTLDSFCAALLDPSITAHDLHAFGSSRDSDGRLSVYRNNIAIGVIDAISASFPVTQAIVGDDFFRAMVRERIHTDSPTSPVLTEYAVGLPAFIRAFPPASSVPYLSDVAEIEALRIETYHAADVEPLTYEAYRALVAAPELFARTGIRLSPSCRWLRCDHAAYSVWAAHDRSSDYRSADLSGIDIEQPEDVLIVRPRFDPVTVLLPSGGYVFLERLSSGRTLQSALVEASETCLDVDPSSLMALLVERELAISFTSDEAHVCN